MSYDLDWNVVDKAVNPSKTSYLYADVGHLFRKVAFDVYKPLNGSNRLWELREGDDGQKYLFALYDEPEDITVQSGKEARASWSATPDKDGKNITLSFKNVPIVRFASARYKFAPEEAENFAGFLEAKAQDKQFLEKLYKILPDNKKKVLAELSN